MVSMLPLYLLVVQYGISLAGLYEFTSVHRLRPSPLSPLWLAISFLPFQWLLGYAALRAVWRQIWRNTSWEKTRHVGAHRVDGRTTAQPAGIGPGQLAPEDVKHG
jgi:hypothetical protein